MSSGLTYGAGFVIATDPLAFWSVSAWVLFFKSNRPWPGLPVVPSPPQAYSH